MAGGAGVEWYFGYKHPHSDLTCQDFRVRENMWQQSHIALRFFAENKIPFWEMANANQLMSHQDGYCLHASNSLCLVFVKDSQPTSLDLTAAKGEFEVLWFNPRKGGQLRPGTKRTIQAGRSVDLGSPRDADGRDWLADVRSSGSMDGQLGENTDERRANR